MVTPNTRTLESNSTNPETRESSAETLAEQRQRWARLLLSQHYQPLIAEVLEEELPKYAHSSVIDATDTVQHMRDCALILASASPVLTAAVAGNLVMRIQTESSLQTAYTALSDRAHSQPSIYAHFLTDEYGTPPTPTQYLAIGAMVQDYVSEKGSSEHAWHIDNMTHPIVPHAASIQGHRKYLHTTTRSSKREQTLHRLCHGIQARCIETPLTLHNTPFAYPPAECGYSGSSHTRIAQHRRRQSSNYVMNLVEDICTYLYEEGIFPQHFRMHAFILFLVFRQSMASMAEILCSALLQVWVHRGGGFNAYPAGRSVATAGRVSGGEWEAYASILLTNHK
ncbi:uncharacterized protein SETTUDRAFT_28654 [Exserohilum turcica Et28A]|uniref:Uncharacterized protein n=1 Tax=Exserohilum turcicum (strain 28A) TaxID=671987 RepID=R0JZE9_EXST2|nr:uncharacterized protein SETTUDRAFT_28654 [Exserohilum turcica Et28A]EOA86258.1 hypothetical protein SETTUDRAFT_28654 [Exserohilum turcica Et28A]